MAATNNKLKPPKHFVEWFTPRCCATCKHLLADEHQWWCERPQGPRFDGGEFDLPFRARCDRWSSQRVAMVQNYELKEKE